MNDAVVRGLLGDWGHATVVVATKAARAARAAHGLAPGSASMLAQGLVGALLLASPEKSSTRINLQVSCDGPLGSLFVDASGVGNVRGYVGNPALGLEGAPGAYRWRALLGNTGTLSVLRDLSGRFYRSTVALAAFDLGQDLNNYFATSDQLPTWIAITVEPTAEDALGRVGGLLVQCFPEGDRDALGPVANAASEMLARALETANSAGDFAVKLLPGIQVLAEHLAKFVCECSLERILAALATLPASDISDIIDKQGHAVVTCQFCARRHEVSREALERLLLPS